MAPDRQARMPSEFSDKDLSEYAMAYLAAYTGTVEIENPRHWPIFAKEGPYAIEVCRLPNGTVCMLFERAETQSILVSQRDWSYLESKALSGLSRLVTVQSREAISPSAAISKGKRDAMRDIRSLETSDFAIAADHISRLVEELSEVSHEVREPVKKAEFAVQRLAPIKEMILRAGQTQDLLAMIDSLKSCPSGEAEEAISSKMLGTVSKEIGDLMELMRRVEAQEARIGGIEEKLVKEIADLKTNLDKRVGRALGMIMTSTDYRVDKAIANLKELACKGVTGSGVSLVPEQIEELRRQVESLAEKISLQSAVSAPGASRSERETSELQAAVADLRMRVQRIEDYLVLLSRARASRQP